MTQERTFLQNWLRSEASFYYTFAAGVVVIASFYFGMVSSVEKVSNKIDMVNQQIAQHLDQSEKDNLVNRVNNLERVVAALAAKLNLKDT